MSKVRNRPWFTPRPGSIKFTPEKHALVKGVIIVTLHTVLNYILL
jgi:hypothetical protein